jgi:EAL and modified HD-GYP domain-containing signal transduction protein
MDIFVARQPIFDRKKKIYAYELLFRSGESNVFPDIDGDIATTSLLSSSFFTIGIDKIVSGKPAFINFTEELIAKGTPHLFPSTKVRVEILETVTPSAEIVASCNLLKDKGYGLVLDDFVYSKQMDELLTICDIIKIDFRSTPLEKIEEMVLFLKKFNCKLLAEKVETYAELTKAMNLGFHYFQGFFFSKPEIVKSRDLSTSQITLIQLISQIHTQQFDVEALGKLVSHDVAITYKLLNYLNSAYFNRLQPISSINQAISYLGESGFKLFVSLIATSLLAKSKPDALIKMAVIRARFLQLIGLELGKNDNELFLLGLFSLIDAMLDKNIEEIVEQLPLTKMVKVALVHRSGELFLPFRLIETYETGNWIAFRFAQKRLGIEDQKVLDFYLESLAWAESLT